MINSIKKILIKALDNFNLVIINKNQRIIELSNQDEKLIDLVANFSMTPKIRIYNLLQALRYVKQKSIEGDFVECGVWKGGNLILFKNFIDKELKDFNRSIFAYDTFEGMSEPDENDFDLNTNMSAKKLLDNDKNKSSNTWGKCSLDEVKNNLSKNISNFDNIKFIKGKVEETLENLDNLPEKISILRLDTDWYKSTKKELEVLYKRVSPGGVIIIDDYGHWGGSKKAVDEFFEGKFVWMHYVDYACRLIIKD
mgnify:CR=1 FL=1